MDKTIILNEIKKHYGFTKDSQLVKHLGITSQILYNWKRRNSYNIKLIYTKCGIFNYEWLLTGKEPMLKKDNIKYNVLSLAEESEYNLYKGKKNHIPLYNLDRNGGLRNIFNKKLNQKDIIDFIKLPDLADCDGATYVKGNSMLPAIQNGDIVIFKTISLKDIFWGELYIIEISMNDDSYYILIKYIQKSEKGEQFVKLIGQDSSITPQDIPVSKINAMALIRGSIRIF
jgi:phage repressor protein C with HTH and peptisase S24 domain